jgi:hypothetical protein
MPNRLQRWLLLIGFVAVLFALLSPIAPSPYGFIQSKHTITLQVLGILLFAVLLLFREVMLHRLCCDTAHLLEQYSSPDLTCVRLC